MVFSAKQSVLSYNYTIFEAEVASTFNEELLFRSMLKNTSDPKMRAYLLSIRVSDILATLYRQTMFAEYEHITHKLVEEGTPLTIENLRSEYRKLLTAYFGPAMHFEECSDLEGLRIPHFTIRSMCTNMQPEFPHRLPLQNGYVRAEKQAGGLL